MTRKIHIPEDLQFHEVKLPGKGINLSVPTAQDGLAAVEYFIEVRERLLTDGMPYNEAARAAFYDARIRFGADELIRSIALCAGQEPFLRALEEGKVYRTHGTEYAEATEEEQDELDEKDERERRS